MIGDKLEIYTFSHLLNLALSNVPDDLDKRQGSIIYDALAPVCYRLAEAYQKVRYAYIDTYALTSTGEELDNRVAEQGITRYAATHAVKKAYITDTSGNPMSIPLGSRFSTISDIAPVNYVVISAYYDEDLGAVQPGYYNLECEVAGSVGNEYAGELVNITNILGIGTAIMSTLLTPARDQETDEELRERYFEALLHKSYGGNRAQYREQIGAIPGVGSIQIYSVWNGGGTVKVSILDADKNVCTPEFIQAVQNEVDPENAQGQRGSGLGLAPIGHWVTVDTPDEITVNVAVDVNFSSGYVLSQLATSIKDAVNNYIKELREEWDNEDKYGEYHLTFYQSRMSASILSVIGIANVANLTLNGQAADIELIQTGQLQQVPKVGTITVNGEVI